MCLRVCNVLMQAFSMLENHISALVFHHVFFRLSLCVRKLLSLLPYIQIFTSWKIDRHSHGGRFFTLTCGLGSGQFVEGVFGV